MPPATLWAPLLLVILGGALVPGATGAELPQQSAWLRGSRVRYYEFGGIDDVGGRPARMYRVVTSNEWGAKAKVAGQVDIVDAAPATSNAAALGDASARANYTGIWEVVFAVVPDGVAPPTPELTSAEALLEEVEAGGLVLEPAGYSTHCPVVADTTTLAGRGGLYHIPLSYRGEMLSCLALQQRLRGSPAPPVAHVLTLKKLPNRVHVPGNNLIDIHPDEVDFVPLFQYHTIYVAPTYVDQSTTGFDGLPANHERDMAPGAFVTWYITEVEPPVWDTRSYDREEVVAPGVAVAWDLKDATLDVRVRVDAGLGWVGLGFGNPGAPLNHLTENVIIYRTSDRSLCTTFAYVPEAGGDIVVSPDNVMGVTNVAFTAAYNGTMTAVFTRNLVSQITDSAGTARPQASLYDGFTGRLAYGYQSGPMLDACAASAAELIHPQYFSGWRVRDVFWDRNGADPVTIMPTPVPFVRTPSPALTYRTPAPLEVPAATVRGRQVVNYKMTVEWEMRNREDLMISLRYSGDLHADRKWMGVGLGGPFSMADIVTVWVDREGKMVAQDRKGIGLTLPPLDYRQDVALVGHAITPHLTVVNVTRKLRTGDFHDSVQKLPSELPRRMTLKRQTGWYAGKRVSYFMIDTPGGPFQGPGPFAAPVYKFQREASAAAADASWDVGSDAAIPGQMPLITRLPGQQGYSDLREVVVVRVPEDYSGPAVTWAHSIPEAWPRAGTGRYVNCPVVDPSTKFEDPVDTQLFKRVKLWHDGEVMWCMDFTGGSGDARRLPPALPIFFTPAGHQGNNSVMGVGLDGEYLPGLWQLVEWNSTTASPDGTAVDPLAFRSVDALPAAALQQISDYPAYVNRPLVDVVTTGTTPVPVAAPPSSLDKQVLLHSEPGSRVWLRWNIDALSGTMNVEIESEFGRGYVAIGFSNASYTQMDHADIVVGYIGLGAQPCVRSLRSERRTGLPTGKPTLNVHNARVEVVNERLRLSFTRGVDGNASPEGRIPADEYAASRVIYAAAPSAAGSCHAGDMYFLYHGTNPHGSRPIYWRLTGNGTYIPPTAEASGLPMPLDREEYYELESSWVLDSRVMHYSIENGLQTANDSASVVAMNVYDIWWPRGRHAIIDSVPGLSDYSDLMRVRRVRLPDGFTGSVTSFQQLREVQAFVEDTDEYWNCPIVPSGAEFEGKEPLEMRQLWYKDQLVQCAFWGNLSSGAITPIYELYDEGDDESPAANTSTILTSTPSSIAYSPFALVTKVVLKAEHLHLRSAPEILAHAVSVAPVEPPRVLNIPIVWVDPGTPVPLNRTVIPVKPAWVAGRRGHYIDFTGQNRSIVPVHHGALLTSEVFVFRRDRSYWSAAVQNNVAGAVPGQTGYSDLWKVTIVQVPENEEAATPRVYTRAEDIPDAWKHTSDVLVNCAMVHPQTTVAPHGGVASTVRKVAWFWAGAVRHCLLIRETTTKAYGAVDALTDTVHISATEGGAAPIFEKPPPSTTGFVVPRQYTPPLLSAVEYKDATTVAGYPGAMYPWAINWPLVSLEGNAPMPALEYAITPVLGVYRGKDVNYWPVANTTYVLPTAAGFREVRPSREYREGFEMHTSGVYIFTRNGRPVSRFVPVFDSVPGDSVMRDGVVSGYSDLKRVWSVDIPIALDLEAVAPPRSVGGITAMNWTITEVTGVFYNWIILKDTSTVPSGTAVRRGWAKGAEVVFLPLSEQATDAVSRAYRVASGRLVFPELPGQPEYTAFHTVWEVPTAPDTFDPTTDLSDGRYAPSPAQPMVVHNLPILTAPSASSLANEVDVPRRYHTRTAWMDVDGDVKGVEFYSFANNPSPLYDGDRAVHAMPTYALRYSTAYTALAAQNREVAAAAAGEAGYSDLHRVRIVNVAASESSAFPLRSMQRMFREALQHSWKIVDAGRYRVAPAVHVDSTLANAAHALMYPKTTFYHGGREVVTFDFGGNDLSQTPTVIYKVINMNNQVGYILPSSPVPAARFCREKVLLAATPMYPLTTLNASWHECRHRTSEATCPREHCLWTGVCRQPDRVYVCALASAHRPLPPPISLQRQQGWHNGVRMWFYESPYPTPGNATHAAPDTVYEFRYPPKDVPNEGETRTGAPVPTLPPVFATMPVVGGGAAAGAKSAAHAYSNIHRVVVVTVPVEYEGGAITSEAEVLEVMARLGWRSRTAVEHVNWWVVNPSSEVDARDAALVQKHMAYAEGAPVAYFDFGVITDVRYNQKYVVMKNGEDLRGNDLFENVLLLGRPTTKPYSPLYWEVAVLVGSNYQMNYTKVEQLPLAALDFEYRGTVANNPVVMIEPPIGWSAYDDLPVDVLATNELSWAYGPLKLPEQDIARCEERGAVKVALRGGEDGAVDAPSSSEPGTYNCARLSDAFTYCWAIFGEEVFMRFVLDAGLWGAVGLTLEEETPDLDIYYVYQTGDRTPRIVDAWGGVDSLEPTPSADDRFGGAQSTVFRDFARSARQDSYNVTFSRALDTLDGRDVQIERANATFFYAYWAGGSVDDLHRGEAGMLCVNFMTGAIKKCAKEDPPAWWVDFTAIYFVLMMGAGLYLTRYSPKNFFLRGSEHYHMTPVQVYLVLSYLGLVAMWIAGYHYKYDTEKKAAPVARAFGGGALLCYTLLLVPAARSSPILWCFNITKQRARRWNRWNGAVLLTLLLAHLLGAVIEYSAGAISWKGDRVEEYPGLAGFLAFLGLLFQAMISRPLTGGKPRWLTHVNHTTVANVDTLTGLWVLIWAHVHYPPLIYGTAVPIFFIFMDKLFWVGHWVMAHGGVLACCMMGHRRSAICSYQDDTFAGGTRVAALEVKIAVSNHNMCYDPFSIEWLRPLHYVYVKIPAAGSGWHPLTITNRPVHVEDDVNEPLKGEPTVTATLHVVSKEEDGRRTWSGRVFQCCRDKIGMDNIRIIGPYGRPSIDVRKYEHLVLVAGGMGAAPLMGLIEYYLDPRWGQQVPLGQSRTKLITLVWAAKDRRMFDLFCGGPAGGRNRTDAPPGIIRMALDVDHDKPTSNFNFVFRCFLHETGAPVNPLSRGELMARSAQGVDHLQQVIDEKASRLNCASIQLLRTGRPNLFNTTHPDGKATTAHPNVFDDIVAQNEQENVALPGLDGPLRNVGVVVCGPESMVRGVRASVDKHNLLRRGITFHMHTEMWH